MLLTYDHRRESIKYRGRHFRTVGKSSSALRSFADARVFGDEKKITSLAITGVLNPRVPPNKGVLSYYVL
jgi:hypothetical protein